MYRKEKAIIQKSIPYIWEVYDNSKTIEKVTHLGATEVLISIFFIPEKITCKENAIVPMVKVGAQSKETIQKVKEVQEAIKREVEKYFFVGEVDPLTQKPKETKAMAYNFIKIMADTLDCSIPITYPKSDWVVEIERDETNKLVELRIFLFKGFQGSIQVRDKDANKLLEGYQKFIK